MQTNLNVTSLDGENKKSTKAITFVNSNSTNAQLKTLAQKFTAISSNTYQDAERINRMSVEEPYSPPVPKQTPTLSVTSTSDHGETIQEKTISQKKISLDYNGDGTIFTKSNNGYCKITVTTTEKTIYYVPSSTPTQGATYTITIFASEGTIYAANK